MLILKLAIRNLTRHTRKSLTIGLLIMLGVAILFVANAIFESTNQGLQSTFVRSVTGDAVMSAYEEVSYGLFGSEVPIVSDYESIPAIGGFSAISDRFGEIDGLEAWTPLVSAAAQMRLGGASINVPVFGVDPATYFSVCSDIVIKSGDIQALSAGGVFINSSLAADLERRLGRSLVPGEPITFSMYTNGSFKVRAGHFAGIHAYPAGTEVMDRLVLTDPTIVRGLVDYTLGYVSSSSPATTTNASGNLDDLFGSATDQVNAPVEDGLSLDALASALADTAQRNLVVSPDAAAWSFALFKAHDGQAARMIKSMRDLAASSGWSVRVLDWRTAAGSSAQALFAVQGAFYIGIGFVILGAILVIMNALVISVLERSAEIGTMRGIGARAGFIRSLFIAESMVLTMAAAAIGIVIGIAISLYAARVGIRISNPLLVSLFGGDLIRPVVSMRSALMHLGMAALVGALAWIYPVSLAMRIQPVSAMNGS
ncbi:MAG TPA: FtsX-like permease family protein [bacterium]|nr:FtsX-like permease family protein [bacterium]